jgi:hypothetical protein
VLQLPLYRRVIVHRAERQVNMKQAVAVAAFILFFFAIPAHAQRRAGGAAGSSSAQLTGGGGGGFSGGSTAMLPDYPSAHFNMREFSGSEGSFIPSGYVPFDRAVAQGQAILDAEEKTPAEAAAATSIAAKPRAKVAVVQDVNGDPIVIKQ